jgi:ABC-type multidrug transport system fused ATPase/permease subunit
MQKTGFGFRLAVIGALFTTAVAMFVASISGINAALAGFALTCALRFSYEINWLMRFYTETEINMNATERVLEYSSLAPEKPDGEDAPASWPTEGRLAIDDLVVGYADGLPAVLQGLSFSVEGGQRVGIIGRTGAGKSSLALALFRFLEARSGSITIDGIDISKLKLFDLRNRLAIIPQDPTIFSGTIRSNLDPFNESTDDELKAALHRVHLMTEQSQPESSAQATATVEANVNIFNDLHSNISEGGLNLSQGQRQLLCLARAIIRRSKIMILDEATSAVDMETDALIQRSIREDFEGSTLLVIAHRLSTIADFDKILVMADGAAEEFGSPKELLEKKGAFYEMVQQSGETEKLVEIVMG